MYLYAACSSIWALRTLSCRDRHITDGTGKRQASTTRRQQLQKNIYEKKKTLTTTTAENNPSRSRKLNARRSWKQLQCSFKIQYDPIRWRRQPPLKSFIFPPLHNGANCWKLAFLLFAWDNKVDFFLPIS